MGPYRGDDDNRRCSVGSLYRMGGGGVEVRGSLWCCGLGRLKKKGEAKE